MAIYTVLALGLDKTSCETGLNAMPEFSMVEALPHLRLPVSPPRTMNERRAAISCYILSSAYATCALCHSLEVVTFTKHAIRNSQLLGLVEPLRWNTHLAEYLKVLAEKHETINDLILVEICRIRLITDKIVQLTRPERGVSEAPRAPLYLHMNALKQELDRLKSEISPDLVRDSKSDRLKPSCGYFGHITDGGDYRTHFNASISRRNISLLNCDSQTLPSARCG